MPPVSQRIPNLLGGVSQQAPHQRKSNELEASVNAYHSRSKGFGKRPNTVHIGQLSDAPELFDNAVVRILDYGVGRRFYVAVLNQELLVWDETGVEQTVSFPHGKTYLALTESGSIRTATVGARTFIANREIKVQRDVTQKSPVSAYGEAVLYVEQADFSTKYSVTLDGVTVNYETGNGSDPSARKLIATTNIAEAIKDALATQFDTSLFEFARFGSMIRIRTPDGRDFSVSAEDGLADNALIVLKDRVQNISELPLRCVNGFIVEVAGDPSTGKDNFWVEFETRDTADFRGVWKECVRPGEGIALSASTMPHELVYSEELTPEMEAKGPPAAALIGVSGSVKIYEVWQSDLNGAVSSIVPVLNDHGEEEFVNLDQANGGPIRVGIRFDVNTTKMLAGEVLKLLIDYNDGTASTTWTNAQTLIYPPGVYKFPEVVEVDIPANIGANFDIRARVEYEGGVTPDPGKVGTIYLSNGQGVWFYKFSERDITFRPDALYPKGTEWTVDVDGEGPYVYTQTDDLTGEELVTEIKDFLETTDPTNFDPSTGLYDLSAVDNDNGIALRFSLADGTGLPDVTVEMVWPSATNFWNPDINLGFTGDQLDGMVLKNLSDGSEGVISDCYQHGITVASLTGGTDNIFRDGDICIVVDPAGEKFIFKQVNWKLREAGSGTTNPWPSFRDDYIRDVFYHRGRLGILASNSVAFSEAGVPENFFRTVTAELIDSDPIDVEWSGGGNARFHSAVAWNEEIVLFGDRAQIIPRGDPVLSPKTIRLDLLSSYPCDPTARPEAAGRFVFYGRAITRSTQVQVLRISPRTRVAEALTATTDVPTYLVGAPVFLAADPTFTLLLIATDDDPTVLYHLTYQLEDDVESAFSWGQWQFTGDVLAADMDEGIVTFIMKYGDGIYLETLDLSTGL